MFEINQIVFCPMTGVARVAGFIEKVVGSQKVLFVHLVFIHKDITMLIPKASVATSGVREIVSSQEIDAALLEMEKSLSVVKKMGKVMIPGWNRRQKHYQLRMSTGRFVDLLGVYNSLMQLAEEKTLSFGERTLLGQVEDLLVQEIVTSRSCSKDDALVHLRAPFLTLRATQISLETQQDPVDFRRHLYQQVGL